MIAQRANRGFRSRAPTATETQAMVAFMRGVKQKYSKRELRDLGFAKGTVDAWFDRGTFPQGPNLAKLLELMGGNRDSA